jgi:hypothetical protein
MITNHHEEAHVEYRVVRLDDDPALSPEASRRRGSKSGAWKRKRYTPRKVTKPHQHHMLTALNTDGRLH